MAGIARIAASPGPILFIPPSGVRLQNSRDRPSNIRKATRPTTTTFVYENREVEVGAGEGEFPQVVSVDFEQSLFRGMVR